MCLFDFVLLHLFLICNTCLWQFSLLLCQSAANSTWSYRWRLLINTLCIVCISPLLTMNILSLKAWPRCSCATAYTSVSRNIKTTDKRNKIPMTPFNFHWVSSLSRPQIICANGLRSVTKSQRPPDSSDPNPAECSWDMIELWMKQTVHPQHPKDPPSMSKVSPSEVPCPCQSFFSCMRRIKIFCEGGFN